MNYVHLLGSVNKKMLSQVIDALDEAKGKPMVVRITSGGGSPDIARAIAGLLVSYKGRVTTEIYGDCESAAVLIFAAGAVRRMQRYSWIMVHQTSIQVGGTVDQVRNNIKNTVRMENQWNEVMVERTGTAVEVWHKLDRKDSFLSPEECLSLNLATEIF